MSQKSLKRFEGYYLLDHTQSPGNKKATEGKVFESATYTCSHCNRIVLLHPDRTRARGYCPGCDRYVCDACEQKRPKTGCTSLARLFDEIEKKLQKQEALDKLRIL
jgi:hypothetical protein